MVEFTNTESSEQTQKEEKTTAVTPVEESKCEFAPSVLRVKKRHTRILGTINKRANQEFIDM